MIAESPDRLRLAQPALVRVRALSLRAKLITAFLLVTLLSVGIVSGVEFTSTRARLVNDVGGQLGAQARSDAFSIGAILEREVINLRTIAIGEALQRAITVTNRSYDTLDATTIQARLREYSQRWRSAPDTDRLIDDVLHNTIAEDLREYQQNNPDDSEIIITDRYGALVAASGKSSAYTVADEDWWRRTWNEGRGATYITQPIAANGAQAPSIIIAEPVHAHDSDQVIGVISTVYRLSTLLARIREIYAGQNQHANLLIGEKLLAPTLTGATLSASDLAQFETARGTAFAIIDFQGQRQFTSIAAVSAIPEVTALGWQLILQHDETDALGPVNRALENTLIIIFGLFVLVLVLSIGIAQVISAPIKRISAAARQIADGDFSQRLGYSTGDEIGQLAQSFDHMARALELRIALEQQAQAERLQLQEQIIQSQSERLDELSSPLIPLTSGVLLLPLIGAIDSLRSERILQTLLEGVAQRRAHAVILDMTGVPVIDLPVAQALLRAAQGARLMGAKVVLAGIRAEVAQTLVMLGADLSMLPICADLHSAIMRVTENK